MNNMIVCQQLCKTFQESNQTQITVLNAVSLEVKAGEKLAIIGPSGSGKSTLLHLLGGLDKPSAGSIELMGKNWQTLSERARCQLRNQHLGFIYQFHHLLPEFTALENVAMPLLIAKKSMPDILKRARELLAAVGLSARLEHKPSQLSGGERQRVAIARALIHHPACVLADEPTGNLDQETAAHVFELMHELNTRHQTALVMVTHDLTLAKKMDRCFTLTNGELISS